MFMSIAMAAALSGPVQVEDPLETVRRLAAAAVAERPFRTAEERAAFVARKARFEELLIYVEKTRQVIAAGKWTSQDFFNYLQVQRDLVDAGCQLCVLPEERLCWQRVGLSVAYEGYRFTKARVAAGTDPPQQLNQARAQFELFRAQYYRAREECNTSNLR